MLLIEAPLIAFPFFAGDQYRGINIAHFGNDEHHYLTRAKEVLEGHALGQPYLAEGKDLPDSFHSNIEQVLLAPVAALGLGQSVDIVWLYNILNAVGVTVLLVLMCVFAYTLSRNVLLAVTSALFVIGGYSLIQNGTILYTIFHDHQFFYTIFNIFGRSIFPYSALVPFFGFLILTYRAVTTEFKKFSLAESAPYLFVLGAGALFGFLFYVYFYAWTFAIAFLAALAFACVLWRKWRSFFVTIAIGSIGVLLGLCKLVAFYRFFTSAMGEQISYFFLTIHGRGFIMSTTGVATAILFSVYLYLRRTDKNNFFIFAMILAGWIALEQQMITGRTVQYGHYYWYFVVPLSIIVSLYMAGRLIALYRPLWMKSFCFVLIAIVFITTAGGQYESFKTTASGKLREQDFAPIIAKLQHMPEGVVLGDPGTETYPLLVTIYTNNDTYWAPEAPTSYFPIQHLREAILVYWYLNKDMRPDPAAYVTRMLATSERSTYVGMYEDLERYESGKALDRFGAEMSRSDPTLLETRKALLPALEAEYRLLTKSPENVRATLLKRGVRYVLWDMKQYPEWDLSPLAPMSLIATSTDIALYELSAK